MLFLDVPAVLWVQDVHVNLYIIEVINRADGLNSSNVKGLY